jgi:hypothetical protein
MGLITYTKSRIRTFPDGVTAFMPAWAELPI